MNLKLNEVKVARDIAEDWFAALPDTTLDHIYRNQENDQVGIGYKEVVQIYTTRILTALNDYESANTFLEYNSILNDHQKKVRGGSKSVTMETHCFFFFCSH